MNTSMPPGGAKPFTLESPLRLLREPYPTLEQVRPLGGPDARRAREVFVRLWLTEGIPFAFRDCPAIYEELRGWIAHRLRIDAKDVTLLGSARVGFSLGAGSRLGRPFGPTSDLDLCVVSHDLFSQYKELFDLWARDYKEGAVRPRNDRERGLWEENLAFGLRNLPHGFFDANKIPTLDRYRLAQQLGQACWALVKKLEQTPNAPVPGRASVRIYLDWSSLIRRVSLNLRWALSN